MILREGELLNGRCGQYKVGPSFASGAFAYAHRAVVTQIFDPTPALEIGQAVVIRIPKLDPERFTLRENETRLQLIQDRFRSDYLALSRLSDLSSVAAPLDYGSVLLELAGPPGVPALFLVSKLVEGDTLDKYMEQHYDSDGEFRGLRNEHDFFRWAIELTEVVRDVHERLVIHGDIWSHNVMVDQDNHVVLIDFGQALFRDVLIAGSREPHPYLAPEGSAQVSGDIYALGALFYYLATGQEFDRRFLPHHSADLKRLVQDRLDAINPELYRRNPGVADVIARCLRARPEDRAQTAEDVLQDLYTFAPGPPPDLPLATYGEQTLVLPPIGDPLLRILAQTRIVALQRAFEEMSRGVYDLIGSRDEITLGLTQYLSLLGLGEDDQYLTVSLPSIWFTRNLGYNGRCLSINKLIAQRGASVRRVFVLTPEEIVDRDVRFVMQAHQRVIAELETSGIRAKSRDPEGGGYWAGYVVVDPLEREELIRRRRHFGLVRKDNHQTWVFPVYRQDQQVVALQFRSTHDEGSELLEFFAKHLSEATPITDFD